MKKLTQQDFIDRSNELHDYSYDYSLVEFHGRASTVSIICKTHGIFEQVAGQHLQGYGCRKCGRVKASETLFKNHGVTSPLQSKDIKQKAEQTTRDRHGVSNIFKNKEYIQQCTFNKLGVDNIFKDVEYIQQCTFNKLGVKSASSLPEVKERRRQTNNMRFGYDNIFKNKEYIQQCTFNKLGVVNPSQLPEIQIKKAENYFNNHGVTHQWKVPEIYNKCIQTWISNYNTINPSQALVVKLKKAENYFNNHGVTHQWKVPEIYNKCIQTWMTNYGVVNPSQKHLSSEILKLSNDPVYLTEQHHVNKFTISKISDILGINASGLQRKFDKLNIDKLNFKQSQGERDIVEWLSGYNINTILGSRQIISPLELDIFLPDYNIAIEYCGIYWHSESNGRDSKYHLNKTQLCQEKNIRLIHIFENEWILQPDIVKSRLLSIIHQNTTIYARKCKIVNLTSNQVRDFFNTTHIQGFVKSSIVYGLEYNNELVSVMSFGKSRFNKQVEWELIRYSNKLNCSVVGGASKLFNHFIKHHSPSSIISYSDKRWNIGSLYIQLGFEHSHVSTPNYFYFTTNKPLQLYSRQQFQKHKLPSKLELYNHTLSEYQNMVNNGYDRIWDCGNDVFIWNSTTST